MKSCALVLCSLSVACATTQGPVPHTAQSFSAGLAPAELRASPELSAPIELRGPSAIEPSSHYAPIEPSSDYAPARPPSNYALAWSDSDATPAETTAPVPLDGEREIIEGTNYGMLKVGYYGASSGDVDDGYIINLSYGRYFTRLFSLEGEAGYFEADGGRFDLDGVPLMLNGRVSIPLWLLELYGGLGIGTIYFDASGGGFDEDGWLLAGNALLGTNLVVLDRFTLGLEGKYYVTEDDGDLGSDLDAVAFFLTGGLRF